MKENTEKLAWLEAENARIRQENTSFTSARKDAINTEDGLQPPIYRMRPLNSTLASEDIRQKNDQTPSMVDDPTLPRGGKTSRLMGSEQETTTKSVEIAYIEALFSKRLNKVEALIERLPDVALPIQKSAPHSYAETTFSDEIALTEMPRKFTMKMYDVTTDLDNHVAQYKL